MIPVDDLPGGRDVWLADEVDRLIDAGQMDQEAYERLLRRAHELEVGLPNLFYLENRARKAGVQTHGLSLVPAPRRLWTPSGLK